MTGSRSINRTATFAWSPQPSSSYIASGTKAGAVDEGFSNETQLELWKIDLDESEVAQELKPLANVATDARFNDIAWTQSAEADSAGVIAGALENGSLDLWDATKLLNNSKDALISRTSKHSAAIKALQFNAFRSELLATVGAKGELFVVDINNSSNPFRMGNAVARADDFECLDWNKKTSHIMVTGSSGGTMTVWDVKNKRESLTLNNLGRKPVSAVAWDPIKTTRLATAIPLETEPVILIWDLRNAHAPEKVLKGHDGGILSLSWCQQDSDLLLSCGKDNRTMFWNPQTGDSLGEFSVVTNWTFQTRWNPHNPNYVATASYDGNILVHPIQNTSENKGGKAPSQTLAADDEDFFTKSSAQPLREPFTLKKTPKWLQRPCGANFAFGGKIVSFKTQTVDNKSRSSVRISAYALDDGIMKTTEKFEASLRQGDLVAICDAKIENVKAESEKSDWKVMKTLISKDARKDLLTYLGFSPNDSDATKDASGPSINGEKTSQEAEDDERKNLKAESKRHHRLSSFFEGSGDGDNFLSEIAASKEAKTNSPFNIFSDGETAVTKRITNYLLLGKFDQALDLCLDNGLSSDAFMIASCGGEQCMKKAQKAYFKQEQNRPNYVRLLATVVGSNLWDLVHNAGLKDWKESLAMVCTYADAKQFPDLCETLGDRLAEHASSGDSDSETFRQNAILCFLAGSKLEKVTTIWLSELQEQEGHDLKEAAQETGFSVHAKSLQSFVEKVTVFREATKYEDEQQNSNSDWRLSSLYDRYIEYADIACAHGQLDVAQRYLDLLPNKYAAAEVAKSRISTAAGRNTKASTARKSLASPTRIQNGIPFPAAQKAHDVYPSANAPSSALAPQNPYAPAGAIYGGPESMNQGYQQSGSSFAPPGRLQTQQPGLSGPPPSAPPPSKAKDVGNWNDMPESFFKPPNSSRRGTPVAASTVPSFQPSPLSPPQFVGPPPKAVSNVGPPPKVGASQVLPQGAPPHPPNQPINRPPSVGSAYTPLQTSLPTPTQTTIQRGPSPYNAPPAGPPASNRYAPMQPQQSTAENSPGSMQAAPHRPVPPPANPYAPQNQNGPLSRAEPARQQAPPPSGPPPRRQSEVAKPAPSAAEETQSPRPKHPPGDRSHIPASAQPVYEILSSTMQRVKSRAPASFTAQVNDTEKRLNLLFDHLNNEDLLKADTIGLMNSLANAVQSRDFDTAQAIHVDIMTRKSDECGQWMVGVKRLIVMSKATPP